MAYQAAFFTDALCAWEQWSLTSFDHKNQHVKELKKVIEAQNTPLANLMDFHLNHASIHLAKVHQLVGATGETNELYTVGRGVTLLMIENLSTQLENTILCAFSLITCALVAGNSILLCSDNDKFNTLVFNAIAQTTLPPKIVQITSFDAGFTLLDHDIRTLAYIGNENTLIELNLQLAKRNAAIANLVSETNLKTPSLIHDPLLSLNFITERTRTINITAIGGNTTLLHHSQ